MKQPNGMKNDVRICRDIVPKNNMDTNREKMWGDLRGGKKSLSELQGAPQEVRTSQSKNTSHMRPNVDERLRLKYMI